ncbi:PAS domain S-box protein [Saccharopolyspora sp. TS4A08]|uniref:PAS domain S-box protein n=1 Tax=Saccharopolyspora ipomoeae TaxID=3042027 RepID=A0ABT6PJQ4_9PSEU|nr:sensor domain-containing diguanylate cyclase [Saccharopolyspora sp. TS4A08]MDI2028177.1 PAS domain S-box protein [Saccharopolyspora sp. TS4A08]
MASPDSAMPFGVTWQMILHQAAAPVVALDLHARIIYANPVACRLLGYELQEVIGRPSHDFTHPDDPPLDHELFAGMIASGTDTRNEERRGIRADGAVIWVLISYALIRDEDGKPSFVFAQYHDITERRTAERRWRGTFNNAPIGMATLDLSGHWIEVNAALCDMLGYTAEEMRSMHASDLTYPNDTSEIDVIAQLAESSGDAVSVEKRYRHKGGYPIWILIRFNVVRGADDQPAYVVAQYETIGDEQLRDSHIAHMALHDPLTGLANRALLMDRINHELAALPLHGGIVMVLVADLDRLKPVNDRFGHASGDQLIVTTADRLLRAVQPGDTVARLGGDEFVVVSRAPDLATARTFRDDLSEQLRTDVVISGEVVELSASVGLASTADTTTPAADLLHDADVDMYARKTATR